MQDVSKAIERYQEWKVGNSCRVPILSFNKKTNLGSTSTPVFHLVLQVEKESVLYLVIISTLERISQHR